MKVARLPVFQVLNRYLQRSVIVICLYWLGSNDFCEARILSSGKSMAELIPVVPGSHVLDEANMFREDREILTAIQGSISRMEDKHDYPVYVAIYYNVYDVSLQDLADELYGAWIGKSGRGMVIVYQLDPVVSGDNPAMAYYKGFGLNPDLSSGAESRPMPGIDVDVLLKRVLTAVNETPKEPIEFISSLIYGIEAEMDRYHELESTSWNDPENLKLMVIFFGVIAAFTLMGMIAWKLLYPVDARSRRVYYFPEVVVERRLGAPYGGGLISEKTFLPASSWQ